MYIETSSPRRLGDNAKLSSPLLRFSGDMCLTFFYHMYGSTIGKLNVIINAGTKMVFSASGNKGNNWSEARVTISLTGVYMVRCIWCMVSCQFKCSGAILIGLKLLSCLVLSCLVLSCLVLSYVLCLKNALSECAKNLVWSFVIDSFMGAHDGFTK